MSVGYPRDGRRRVLRCAPRAPERRRTTSWPGPPSIAFALDGAPSGGWTLRLAGDGAAGRAGRRRGGRHRDVPRASCGSSSSTARIAPQTAWATGALVGQRRHATGAAPALAAGVLSVRAGALVAGGSSRVLLAGCARAVDERRGSADRGQARRASSRSRSTRRARCSSARRSASTARRDGGRTWHTTTRHVWGALAAGFTQASTIVSRGRLLERGNLSYDHVDAPKRSPFHGGSVSRSRGCRAASSTRSCAARTGTSTSRSTRRARGTRARRSQLPRSAQAIAVARAKGAPDVVYAATGRAGPLALRRRAASAGRGCPCRRTRRRSRRRPPAGSTSSPRCPSCPGRTTTARPGTRAGPRATLVASDPRNDRIWYAIAPDGELLVSTDGGRSW